MSNILVFTCFTKISQLFQNDPASNSARPGADGASILRVIANYTVVVFVRLSPRQVTLMEKVNDFFC